MRRKIAVFANGWGTEFLRTTGDGITKIARQNDIDVFSFVNFSSYSASEEENSTEFGIFCLPELEYFDGVMMMPNSFNTQKEVDYLYEKVKRAAIPAVSLEYMMPQIPYIGSDNYRGMYTLVKHMIEEHHVKNIVFIGGIEGHPESQVRMKAAMDAAREYRIRISDDDIIYGQWAADPTKRTLTKWAEEHNDIPDVFICANDIMAMATCEWLMQRGLRVPDDVKVTGYDCIREGQTFEPALTTVTHDWNQQGCRAMELLIEQMDGREIAGFCEVDAGFVRGESCGCVDETEDEIAIFEKKHREKGVDGLRLDQHFRHLYKAIRKDWTAEGLNKSLSGFIAGEGWVEGKSFMLCLHSQFFSCNNMTSFLKDNQPEKTALVICNIMENRVGCQTRMETKDALFYFAENAGGAKNYMCVPLGHDEKMYGFAILDRDFNVVSENVLYIWTRHMNQCLEQVRANVKIRDLNKQLEKLSVTDMLTGVYNRTGCEKILYPFIERCQEEKTECFLLLVDVDKLKIINDMHGHVNGDLALCTVVEVMQSVFPPDYMIGRFGGDEFLVTGKVYDDTLEALSVRLMDAVAQVAKERNVEFPLSVSVGGVTITNKDTMSLEEYLQKADDAMYMVKKRHHRHM